MYTIEIAVVQSVKLLCIQTGQKGKTAKDKHQTLSENRLKRG